MSYLTQEEVEIVKECREHTHKLCALCNISFMACMKFYQKHDMVPDSDSIKECPVCGQMYTDRPALSRREGVGEICPDCGTKEALEDYEKHKEDKA